MLELVKAGGWPMIPLLILSALALAELAQRDIPEAGITIDREGVVSWRR